MKVLNAYIVGHVARKWPLYSSGFRKSNIKYSQTATNKYEMYSQCSNMTNDSIRCASAEGKHNFSFLDDYSKEISRYTRVKHGHLRG